MAKKIPEFALGWIGYSITPALQNVSEDYMDNTFNPNHPARYNVQYYSVAADAGEGTFPFRSLPEWQAEAVPESSQQAAAYWVWNALLYIGKYKGDNDFLVTVRSTEWDNIPGHNSGNSQNLGSYLLNHHSIRAAMQRSGEEYDTIADLVKDLLDSRLGGSLNNQQAINSTEAKAERAFQTNELEGSTLSVISGSINQSQTLNQLVGVDSQTKVSFTILWQDGDLNLNLIDPDGNVITSSVSDPTIVYTEDRSGTSTGDYFIPAKVIVYEITTPQTGQWQAQIVANTSLPSGQANWILLATQNSATTVSLTADDSWYQLNDLVTVFATLGEGGSPIMGANVQVTAIASNDTTQTLTLYDDGSNGDTSPNDGIYTNSFTGNEFGTYRLSVDASGTSSTGIPFQRTATEEVQVGSGTAAFGSGFSDLGLDTDGDGLYNMLRINVPLQVNSNGEYMVSGVLQDSTGVEMGRANAVATYATGSQIVALDFDASAIWANGGQGVFSLRDLRLLDRSNAILPIQVDYSSDAYTTQSYGNDNFQHSPVALTGNGNDFGVDTNGNGKYDELVIEVEVFIEQAGNYTWNARLVDNNGHEFGWDSAVGYLSIGNNTISLQYDGKAIYANRVNGPYYLKDFVLWGDGGYLTVVNAANTLAYNYMQFELVPEQLFLPTVLNSYTSPPNTNVVQNGDFEQGSGIGWQEYSSNGWAIILSSSSLPVTPRNGNWAAWLGGDDNEIAFISQQVTVPTNNPNLRFWYWISSQDACGYDFGGVILNNNIVVDVFDLCTSTNTGGWIQRTVNLSAYAGQTTELEIRAETDSSFNSNLFVDDVTLGGIVSFSSPNDKTLYAIEPFIDKLTQLPPSFKDEEDQTIIRLNSVFPRQR